jgi:hypothetical protein
MQNLRRRRPRVGAGESLYMAKTNDRSRDLVDRFYSVQIVLLLSHVCLTSRTAMSAWGKKGRKEGGCVSRPRKRRWLSLHAVTLAAVYDLPCPLPRLLSVSVLLLSAPFCPGRAVLCILSLILDHLSVVRSSHRPLLSQDIHRGHPICERICLSTLLAIPSFNI